MNDPVFDRFPDSEKITSFFREGIPEVNAHIHTPWSFSAFTCIEQAFSLAAQQHVEVLGINDFITTGGYPEFMHYALRYRIFPLFNIEFIALPEEFHEIGLRVNDPDNPGRTYFCGKGLPFPFSPTGDFPDFLDRLVETGNARVREMAERVAKHLSRIDPVLKLNREWVESELAEQLVRERHLAKAIRMIVERHYPDTGERIGVYEKIFSGMKPASAMDETAALENEIRGRLLKKGGVAYVPEDPETFPFLTDVRDALLKTGGIPCYPVLLDNAAGECTEFEEDPESLAGRLRSLNVHAVEFIPQRNDVGFLSDYVRCLARDGFLVLFGTEHNTPAMTPLKVFARNGVPLPEDIRKTGWDSACVVAAHQYLVSRGEKGYCNPDGSIRISEYDKFVRLGNAVINFFRQLK
ncbi:MAG: hypothetical protein GXO83_11365 [Chlorobi bacterium]|nr:hypothetical protein [Chlorobiota bacterium]